MVDVCNNNIEELKGHSTACGHDGPSWPPYPMVLSQGLLSCTASLLTTTNKPLTTSPPILANDRDWALFSWLFPKPAVFHFKLLTSRSKKRLKLSLPQISLLCWLNPKVYSEITHSLAHPAVAQKDSPCPSWIPHPSAIGYFTGIFPIETTLCE